MGEQALRRGRDEIEQLAEAGRQAPATAEILADFLRDLDDPRRAVEIDDRVTADTGRTDPRAGQEDTKGYTGLEGLLNYVYYQTGALNQYDQIGHLLHFSLYNVNTGPCGHFSSGRDPDTGAPGVPAEDGGTTTNILEADNCVSWLGPNQPGINEDLNLPKYDPSVCPNGTEPPAAEQELCSPSDPASSRARSGGRSAAAGRGEGSAGGDAGRRRRRRRGGAGGGAGGDGSSGSPRVAGRPVPDDILDQILDLPPEALDQLPDDLQDQLGGIGGTQGSSDSDAAADLLDFLFAS